MDLVSRGRKCVIEDLLALRRTQDIEVEACWFINHIALWLIKAGERVPLIPLNQDYQARKQAGPLRLSSTALFKQEPGQAGPLARILDRAIAELYERLGAKD